MALSRLSIIKFLELIVTLACVGLHYNSSEYVDHHTVMLINGTFVGFTIILVALFAGYMMGTPINKRLDLFFSLIGCAMFITSGVLILQHWNGDKVNKISEGFGFGTTDSKKVGVTKGSLAIVNGVLFLVDVVFTFRD